MAATTSHHSSHDDIHQPSHQPSHRDIPGDATGRPDSRLQGRRVLVTGASSGIGTAAAGAIVAAGGRVALLARRTDALHEIADRLGEAATVAPADVTDADEVAAAVSTAVQTLGGLDGLVNAAGLVRPGGLLTVEPADWRTMFEVNVIGLLNATHAALPALRAAELADVINLSSMSGRRRASVEMGLYSATKFAVHVISDSLREELAPEGIRVTVVSPGFVRTPIFDDTPDEAVRDRYRETLAKKGLDAAAVAAQVVHALAQPAGVDLIEIALMSTHQ